MFGSGLRAEDRKPQEADARLTTVLREWKAVEPRGSFELDVWRRIRETSAAERQHRSAVTLLREWLAPRHAWAGPIAAAAGIVVGIGLGISLPAMHAGHGAHEPLLLSQTVAGSYLALVAGDIR